MEPLFQSNATEAPDTAGASTREDEKYWVPELVHLNPLQHAKVFQSVSVRHIKCEPRDDAEHSLPNARLAGNTALSNATQALAIAGAQTTKDSRLSELALASRNQTALLLTEQPLMSLLSFKLTQLKTLHHHRHRQLSQWALLLESVLRSLLSLSLLDSN